MWMSHTNTNGKCNTTLHTSSVAVERKLLFQSEYKLCLLLLDSKTLFDEQCSTYSIQGVNPIQSISLPCVLWVQGSKKVRGQWALFSKTPPYLRFVSTKIVFLLEKLMNCLNYHKITTNIILTFVEPNLR